MDKLTFLREDLEAMRDGGLSDAEIGLAMLAMARYVMDGEETDLSGCPGARMAFAMLRPRLDKYVRKCEANQANGQRGGRPKTGPEPTPETDQTENNPTKPNHNPTETQPKANETYDYDYEYEQAQGEAVTPERGNTHDRRQQGTRARAKPGWFDPADPDGPDDEAWRGSPEARKAVAQRIIDHVLAHGGLWKQNRYTDAGTLGAELFSAVEAALREGIPPGEITRSAQGCMATWVWEAVVKTKVITQGGTLNYPDWAAQLHEVETDLFEILGEQRERVNA